MDFTQTQTYFNLARSFAGECQAGMRYQLIARDATAAGLMALADTLRTIAKNETNHARVFFELLIKHAGSRDNIRVDAGYPFHTGTIAESLNFAAEDEKSEHENIYPSFARTAREEGFEDVAFKFEEVAKVEENHEIVFRYLHESVKNGTLYSASAHLDLRRVRLYAYRKRGVEGLPAVRGKAGGSRSASPLQRGLKASLSRRRHQDHFYEEEDHDGTQELR